jgi:PAS domain S-box-containing protein
MSASGSENDPWQDILDAVGYGLASLDPRGQVLVSNKAFRDFFGISKARLPGCDWASLMAACPPLPSDPFEQATRTGRPASADITRHGRHYTVQLYPKGEPGDLSGAACVVADITEPYRLSRRKKTEEALRESEQRFRSLVGAVPAIVFIDDADGHCEYLSPCFYEHTGMSPLSGLGSGWMSAIHPDDLEGCRRDWDRALREGVPYDSEYRIRAADGSYRWFVGRSHPVRDAAGRVVRWFGTATDVDDLKRTQEALREADERLRAALLAAEMGTWQGDLRTGHYSLDASLSRILGLPEDRAAETMADVLERVHPDDRAEVGDVFRRALEEQTPYDVVYRALRPDGSIRWLRSRGRVILGDDGLPSLFTGAAADVTGLKKAEQEREQLLAAIDAQRREAERQATQMSELFESMTEGITIVDATGRVVLRNAAAAEMTRAPVGRKLIPEEYPGVRLLSLDGIQVPRDQVPVFRLLKGGRLVDEEYLLERADGSRLRIACSGGTVRNEKSEVELAVITFRDMTELRRLERAKDEFLQVLAHELRNPLAAAYGLVQLVMQRLLAEGGGQHANHLRLAESELNRLNGLISEIIAGYRVSGGRLALDLRVINLAEAIVEATRPYVFGQSDYAVTVEPLPAKEMPVAGDARRLVEILANLLSNAVKYSPRGSRIWVRTTVEDGQVLIRVEDEGIGIPSDQLEKVFEGFYRATNVAHRQPGGLGLGLYISRDAARRHGGDLWAENRPGGGSVMCLRLPLATEALPRRSGRAPNAPEG